VPVYNCPSAEGCKYQLTPPPGGQQNYTNYAVNYELLGRKNPGLEKGTVGCATCAPPYTLPGIPDGTSNTVLLAEKNSKLNPWDRPATWEANHAPMFGCVLNTTALPSYCSWAPFTADARDPPLYVRHPGNDSFQRASSVHPKGFVVGAADGAAHCLGYDFSPQAWRKALTPDDTDIWGYK
jgi:hypothetical protein